MLLHVRTFMCSSDVYVNSSDATLLVSSTGDVLDCNGAALIMFRCRRRSDLCGGTQLLDLMYGRDREALAKVSKQRRTSAQGCIEKGVHS